MAKDPELRAHQEWLGYLQPVGLVVSPHALNAAGCHPDRNIVREQQVLIDLTTPATDDEQPSLHDFPRFTRDFLGWDATDLAGGPGGPELPASLTIALPELGEVLSPTHAVPDPDNAGAWLLLVKETPHGTDLDAVTGATAADAAGTRSTGWHASPQARFERLLRETGIPTGLLVNGTSLRLVHAPRGESAGHLTFPIAPLCAVAGRPLVSALHMLLSADRLFTLPTPSRLPALLKQSRKYQNEVSTKLAEQVLAALNELVRGLQAADEATHGDLLRDVLRDDPAHVYGGCLATLLRLVFVLYAEDRGLLTSDPVYQQHYSVAGLFESLRDDAALYPDTMDQRFGAWARLLTLFRLVHDGAAHGTFHLPPRHGRLFDPDTFDFLEGRVHGSVYQEGERIMPPRIPDGCVHRLLEKLLVLDGDRLSYRALDVEQIGSVYEAIMGFELLVARGPSIGVRGKKVPVVIDLADLLAAPPADRAKRLKERTEADLTGAALERLRTAATPDDVIAALGKKVSPLTPSVLPPGSLYLQPTEERRRSGSHYTPRSLTEPIVRTTLEPILKALGDRPRPEQILELKVCDPAMGSGAFLVEACRYLGDALVDAWQAEGKTPPSPPDEDPVLYARRLVAQRCLYGVDKNPFAVDLAKLSLWLATLAREHPFTFLDHALRHGDSLVGLSREQIASFHWAPEEQAPMIRELIGSALHEAEAKRAAIHAMGDSDDTAAKTRLLAEAEAALANVRLVGDLCVAAFFGAEKAKERERLRGEYREKALTLLSGRGGREEIAGVVRELRSGDRPVPVFHWEVEFPEAFSRENPGFDAFVGNPPFAGKNTTIHASREGILDWLKAIHEESHGNADLVAHFFRRTFNALRKNGALGLIATNTIAQGDTRETGLRWICKHGGTIYAAIRRFKWPGTAAVVVSVVHVLNGALTGQRRLDGLVVDNISAFLFHAGGHDSPARLRANGSRSFQGSIVLGMGFTFDDDNPDATPLSEMRRLIEDNPKNAERVFPYIGGEELTDNTTHRHRRHVIDFGELPEGEARLWPDLFAIAESKVRPERELQKDAGARDRWWQFIRPRPELKQATMSLDRVLTCTLHSKDLAFVFLPPAVVFSHALGVFALNSEQAFCLLQSRLHEVWARCFGSSLEDRLRYTPSDCFETFPFPPAWETNPALEAAGKNYYDFRAALMIRNDQGLTATYNRFHDPDERDPDILRLRELHDTMDRAVLDACGWTTLRPTCEFLLDYEEEDDDEDDGRTRRRKKPWRYRWPDDLRDEVLGRLLALNKERAEEERLAAAPAAATKATARSRKARASKRTPSTGTLFEPESGDEP